MQKPTMIFDMDGTLLDLAFDDFIWNETLPIRYAETHQCTLHESQTILQRFYQEYNHTLNWYSTRFWSSKIGVDTLNLQLEFMDRVQMRQGCLELLQFLKQQGYPIWLATNADLAGVQFKLKKTQLKSFFDVIVSSEEIGHAKEEQAFWQKLLAQHPFDVKNAFFIDDTEKVLNSARQFGIGHLYSIVQPSSKKAERTSFNYPMLSNLMDLIPLLNTQEVAKHYA